MPADLMKEALVFFGASQSCLQKLETGVFHDQAISDPCSPNQKFRKSFIHRMILEDNTSEDSEPRSIYCSNTLAVTQIPKSEINSSAECEGKLLETDRSATKNWLPAPEMYKNSSIPRAMCRLHDFFLPEIHEVQVNLNQNSNVVIHDQAFAKVVKRPGRMEEQPTPEGIHQDNSEISSIIFIKTEDVASGAQTRIWGLETPKGYYDDSGFEARKIDGKLLFEHTLSEPFETVFIRDRRIKHEVRYFTGVKDSFGVEKQCSRSVMVNLLRKPLSDGADFGDDTRS